MDQRLSDLLRLVICLHGILVVDAHEIVHGPEHLEVGLCSHLDRGQAGLRLALRKVSRSSARMATSLILHLRLQAGPIAPCEFKRLSYRKLDPTRIGSCFIVWGFFVKEFQGGASSFVSSFWVSSMAAATVIDGKLNGDAMVWPCQCLPKATISASTSVFA